MLLNRSLNKTEHIITHIITQKSQNASYQISHFIRSHIQDWKKIKLNSFENLIL